MITSFFYSLQSELLKTKRSAAAWLVLTGSLLIPLIILLATCIEFDGLYGDYTSGQFWRITFRRSWQLMAMMLLPMGLILVSSLMTQLEFRNNTWKQLHTIPQSYAITFFSKLSVILLMMIGFFILFNSAVVLFGIIPSIIFRGIPFPKGEFPWWHFVKMNMKFFIACLPIVAIQYMVSLRFKNFLVPIGFGIGFYVAAMIAMNWKHGYWIPYIYSPASYAAIYPEVKLYYWSLAYFVLFTIIGFVLYYKQKEKG
jgi:lantibiotic transport system permease protein